MMNSNPWNVESVDEFSYFNCPECTFHSKEKARFEDHATRNHPLSSILFCKGTKLITFTNRNELNQLKHLNNDKKCKEMMLKHKIPDKIQVQLSTVNESKGNLFDIPNIEKRQQSVKVCEEAKFESHAAKKGFHLLNKNSKNITPLSKEERIKNIKNSFHSSKTISNKEQKFNNPSKRSRSIASNEYITPQSRSTNNSNDIFEKIQASVNEFDPLAVIEQDLPTSSNLELHNKEFQNAETFEDLSISDDETIDSGIINVKFSKHSPDTFKLHKPDSDKTWTNNELKLVAIDKGDDPEKNLTENQNIGFEQVKEVTKLSERLEIDMKEGNKDLECSICNKSFSSKDTLKKHLRRIHEAGKSHICSECGDKFYDKRELKVHILSMHEGKKLFRCSICKLCFIVRSNLKKHMISVHGMDNSLNPFELQKMNLIHEVESSLNCEQCGEKFQNKRELKMHSISVHEGKVLYRCSICNFQNQTIQGMKTHIVFDHEKKNLLNCRPKEILRMNLFHQIEKSQTCDQCGEKFENKTELKKHKLSVHEGKQLHRCSFCTACFKISISLKRHVSTVHEKKNLLNPAPKSKKLYQCEFCESKFGIQKFFHAHLKKVHKIDNQQNDGKSPTKNYDDLKNVSFVGKKDFVEYRLPFVGWVRLCTVLSN